MKSENRIKIVIEMAEHLKEREIETEYMDTVIDILLWVQDEGYRGHPLKDYFPELVEGQK